MAQSPGAKEIPPPDPSADMADMADSNSADGAPQVRFAAVDEEIEPAHGAVNMEHLHISGEEETGLHESLQALPAANPLQGRRMSNFAYEPVSNPATRQPSPESSSSPDASRHNTHSSSERPSPVPNSRPSSMHTPPITPAATRSRDATLDSTTKVAPLKKVEAAVDPTVVTPQISPPPISPSSVHLDGSRPGSQGPTRVTSHSSDSGDNTKHGAFSIGPGKHDSSAPSTREPSPTRSMAPPSTVYSRPFTPAGDLNDPYAASKRPAPSKNHDAIDSRFRFTAIGSKHRGSPGSSGISLPKSSRSYTDNGEKRHSSSIFGGHKDHLSHMHDSSAPVSGKHGSMAELKRFLKMGSHHKSKRSGSPTPSAKSGTKTPPHHKTPQSLPFGDDHGLTSKYGKLGKVLGAGAGGSVRLMKRSSDGTTFAVKEFRARHSYESEKEYAKKVTAEFCVGSTLHHGNIIETLDIVHEKGKWYEVMEYAPFDLFAIVMTGKMSREEVSCSFLQILSGVTYLHSMGLAHRDLKLDNVVVNEHGIMKIIDFGSASVFKYPFEGGITLSSGIVGSDPYLAPEVYDERKYDPQPADIWSLAIIYCCMTLRRFPWKMPRVTDNSYKLFVSPPSTTVDGRPLSASAPSKPLSVPDTATKDADGKPQAPSTGTPYVIPDIDGTAEKKADVIKGPYRLLRLLPRESRIIIGRMLEVDPKKRATLSEILDNRWVNDTVICRQEDHGQVIRAEGHTHTLEPPAPAPTK